MSGRVHALEQRASWPVKAGYGRTALGEPALQVSTRQSAGGLPALYGAAPGIAVVCITGEAQPPQSAIWPNRNRSASIVPMAIRNGPPNSLRNSLWSYLRCM